MPDPRSGSGSIRTDGTPRGAGSSRLDAFHSLRAAHADLNARLRRPTLRPGSRYRDLVVFTRLLELEREHLAGRTAYSSTGTAAMPDASGAAERTGQSDPDWSQSWGTAASVELHTVLRRHSVRRERLGRLLTSAARARATAAADQRYDAIALSVPWRAPEGSPFAPRGSAAPPHSATGHAGSSRLEAFHSLRAAQADLKARLSRPTLRPGSRYRDLVVFTRLLELERAHLAGRTAYSSTGTAAMPDASGRPESTGQSDSEWSHSWGTAASVELHTVLRRHAVRRERLGRLLIPAARARATAAADQRYDAIALGVPWRVPDGTRPAPPKSAAPAKSVARPATAEGFPRVKRGARPSYGPVTAGAAAALALFATLVVLDRQGPEPGPGLQADAGPALSAAAAPSFQRLDPVPAASPSANEARKARDRPPARPNRDRDREASQPEPETQPEPAPTDTAVPTSAPAPAPAPATPPAAPAPAPAPEPSPPPAEDPPEFGFEQ